MKRRTALCAALVALMGLAITANIPALAQGTTLPPKKPQHQERHPAIHAAIRALERAKVDLQHAAHDFGGHRATALKECDAAIAELRLALQYDKN